MSEINLFNIDCMEFMKDKPDNYYQLSICDPPYGINHSKKAGKQSGQKYGRAATAKKEYKIKDWDSCIPKEQYFKELFRISKNTIIWGANYMVENLKNSSGWIVWDKDNGENNFSDCELAFTTFNKGLRKVKITWNGMLQNNMKEKEHRIHPTQKPVQLYQWLLQNYAKKGDKIFDSHGGSMSIAIACDIEKFDLDICELDKEYFEKAKDRLEFHQAQSLF